jgi:hypothetical protein
VGQRGTVRAEDYNFFCGKEKKIHQWGKRTLHHRILSAVKRVEFIGG